METRGNIGLAVARTLAGVQNSKAFVDGKHQVRVNEFIACDWCSLFNTPEFFQLHNNGTGLYFQLCLGTPPQPLGVVHFTQSEPGCFRSPRHGTFGSFEVKRPLRLELLERFVARVEEVLEAQPARRIEIVHPPVAFDPAQSAVLANILGRRGYTPQLPELAYVMRVDSAPLWARLEPSRRQRVKRCQHAGIVAKELEAGWAREVYDVIVANREARHYPVTMGYPAICQMLERFPGRVRLFGAFKADVLIASSLCLLVSSSVLYVFYWGDLPAFKNYSSVSLLAECIYQYAQRAGLGLIDFGTATYKGAPAYGLASFKAEIGCLPSAKHTDIKYLDGANAVPP